MTVRRDWLLGLRLPPYLVLLYESRLNMFGLRKRSVTIMEYDCDPVIEGKVYLCFAVLLAVVFAVRCVMEGFPHVAVSVVMSLAVTGLSAWGVWLLRFRRKPLRRTVVLGTMAHDLYLRSKLLFVTYQLAVLAVLLCLIAFAVTMFDHGLNVTVEKFMYNVKSADFLLLYMAYHVMQSYLSFYAYYISPDNVREIAPGGKPE